ncbi:unnamed protein product [Blepharisma stoltei]|uniref:RING-type domain-containing protein n=1 Tax=Blepharisma stoltei TaxID=1481888 RepID=A0AAU9J9Q1_9CILI|nr:unnamed protein product [Blepharisma stoltei]
MDNPITECCICFEEYSERNKPYILSCGHALCGFCLGQLKGKEKKNQARCPQDNKIADVSNLCPAFAMISLIEERKKILSEKEKSMSEINRSKAESERKMAAEIETARCQGKLEMALWLEKRQKEIELEHKKELEQAKMQEAAKAMAAIDSIQKLEEEKRIAEIEEIKKQEIQKQNENIINLVGKHIKNLDKKRIFKNNRDKGTRSQNKVLRNDNRIYWAWKNQENEWIEYAENSGVIESSYNAGFSDVRIRVGNKYKRVNFENWKEIDGGNANKIKRVNTIMAEPAWKIMKRHKVWETLCQNKSFLLDQAWLLGKNTLDLSDENEGFIHFNLVDFTCLIDGLEFPIMRDTVKS